jgi:hypothetical protein
VVSEDGVKLTYCSFAIDDDPSHTIIVILDDHYETQMDAADAFAKLLTGNLGSVPDGQFISWQVPENLNEIYAPHVGRLIAPSEARELFGAKSLGEWKRDEQKKSLN